MAIQGNENNANGNTPVSIIPRAAVSVVVRYQPKRSNKKNDAQFLLVQRGKAPNLGMWSLPGGRIEAGEATLDAAQRELTEETTGWPGKSSGGDTTNSSSIPGLHWQPHPFTSSDAIGEGYHYVISQCFAEYRVENDIDNIDDPESPPVLQPADDAADVGWFTLEHIAANSHNITHQVVRVIEQAEALHQKGLFSSSST